MSSELEARSSEREPILYTELGQLARAHANDVWSVVAKWPPFPRDTVGRQWTRCADSVGANLVEGDGRGSDPDAIRFFVIARASLREAEYFTTVAHDRNLIDNTRKAAFSVQIGGLLRQIGGLIKYRRTHKTSIVRESGSTYNAFGQSSDDLDIGSDALDNSLDTASSPSEL